VVIPAIGELKGLGSACRELMHSYHNVADIRQFCVFVHLTDN
jgi:hypothetical protein